MIWQSTAERLAGHGRMSKAVRLVVVSLISFAASSHAASAATLSLTAGGTNSFLPASFNPSGIAAINADGIHVGSAITYFAGANNVGGLLVSPQNVLLKFDYMGKEASYTNEFVQVLTNIVFFSTATNSPAATTGFALYNVGSDPGLVPFYFKTNKGTPSSSDDLKAFNGGAIASGLRLAFAKVSDAVWYAFFDDGGAGPDKDWDDMVVRITALDDPAATPLPATLPLFAGGLGVIALLARRRKRKSLATP